MGKSAQLLDPCEMKSLMENFCAFGFLEEPAAAAEDPVAYASVSEGSDMRKCGMKNKRFQCQTDEKGRSEGCKCVQIVGRQKIQQERRKSAAKRRLCCSGGDTRLAKATGYQKEAGGRRRRPNNGCWESGASLGK